MTKTKQPKYWKWMAWTFFVVVVVVVVAGLLIHRSAGAKRGTFGDMFGGVNALFSGLAFASVFWAIVMQKKGLDLQKEELEETRNELRGQKEQLTIQAETLKRQMFESSFFRLLSFHHQLVNFDAKHGWWAKSRRKGVFRRFLCGNDEVREA